MGNIARERAEAGQPLALPNLAKLGLFHAGQESTGEFAAGVDTDVEIIGAYGHAAEMSSGKDTPSGHWEIAGLPVLFDWGYFTGKTDTFPPELLEKLIERADLPGVLGNCHASGTTIIAEGASALLNTSAVYLRGGRDFLNNGTLTQSGRAALISDTADATSTITNALGAEWTTTMNDGHTIAYPYQATATVEFTNAGTLTKNGATTLLGHTRGTFNLTNTGTLEVASGTLRLVSNGAVDLSGSITQGDGTILQLYGITTALNGTLEPGVGSVLRVDAGGTLTIPSGKVLSDVEKLIISGSTLILHESHTLADLELASGTLDIRSALSVGTLKLSGTLLAPDDVTITDTLTWTSGTMTGEGTTIIESGASALLKSSAVNLRGGHDLLNKGTLTQSGFASLVSDTADATSTITNASGAQWTTTLNPGYTIAWCTG